MPSFTDFMVVIGMIALRFGIPALAIAGIAFLFKRLDRRWEAEAHEYAAKQAAEQARRTARHPNPQTDAGPAAVHYPAGCTQRHACPASGRHGHAQRSASFGEEEHRRESKGCLLGCSGRRPVLLADAFHG